MLPTYTNVLFCPTCRNPVLPSQDCLVCGTWSYENILALMQMYNKTHKRARKPNSYYEQQKTKDRFAKYAEVRRQTKWYCVDCDKTVQMASRGRHLASPYHHNRLKPSIDPTHPLAVPPAPPTSPSPPPLRLRTSLVLSNGVSPPVVRRRPLIARRRTSA